jgi:hypothetical protein
VYIGSSGSVVFHYAGGTTWERQVVVANDGGLGFYARGIWGSGAGAPYVAESSVLMTGSGGGVYYHSNDWVLIPPTATQDLYAISGNATDVYAVGYVGTLFHEKVGSPFGQENSGASDHLLGVWASDTGDIYVAGGNRTLLHSRGDGNWQSQSIEPGPTTPDLSAVWASGPNDVYVTAAPITASQGPSKILHSSGDGTWTSQLTLDRATLAAIWGSGRNDVYAAGSQSDGSGGYTGILYHSSGDGQWTAVSLPSLVTIHCVGGSGPRDVYLCASANVGGQSTSVLVHGQ